MQKTQELIINPEIEKHLWQLNEPEFNQLMPFM